MLNNLTVVIRSTGERTEKFCYDSIAKQVSEKNIFILRDVKPFSEAVRQNFKIGINQDKKYTLSVDADIIFTDNAISEMVEAFDKLDETYYVYKGLYYDKYLRIIRPVGAHLYRTSLLELGLSYIPVEGETLRPESFTYEKMSQLGHHNYVDNKFYGYHDFDQYYEDIYRKSFLHAKKHNNMIASIIKLWGKDIHKDLNLAVALRGISDGLIYKDIVYVDVNFFKNKSDTMFSELKLKEKNKLMISEIVPIKKDKIQRILKNIHVLDTKNPIKRKQERSFESWLIATLKKTYKLYKKRDL